MQQSKSKSYKSTKRATKRAPLVSAPVAQSRAVGSRSKPTFSQAGGATRITHSEFFAQVQSTTTDYTVSSFPCNPGVASIFPWLSVVAQRYETYKFRDITFRYYSRAATSQVGSIGLVFDFDANDDAPSGQMVALSYHDKKSDGCWKEITLKLDLVQGDKLPTRYTRVGSVSASDLKTLDLGNLHVFTDGVAASANLGLLEVSYVVDLFTPQIQNPVGGRFFSTTGLDATHLVGTLTTIDPQAHLPFTLTSDQVLTFDQTAEVLVTVVIGGTVLSANYAPVVSALGTASVLSQQVNAAATGVIVVMRVKAIPGVTLTPTITGTTVTSIVYSVGTAAYASLS